MYETRVNLKHLLEDIRDSYALPVEEVIITELVANSLDSGAKSISFFIDALENSLTIVDDGKGMRRDVLKSYHNIAATTKHRGEGIGFAGVGAKLSLLLAKTVVTQTRGSRGSRAATVWHLASDTRAPWKFIPCADKIGISKGTAVVINLADKNSPLLSADFIGATVLKHFLPLFLAEFHKKILKYVYPKGIVFYLEGQKIALPSFLENGELKDFIIKFKGQRGPVLGYGFLAKSSEDLPENLRGLAVATFGKIIKRGWEWLGIDPKNNFISGMVEIPSMSVLLTTNKTDFLQDSASLKKYYRFRKAIQEAALPVLAQLGEDLPEPNQQKKFRRLSGEIERALSALLGKFPELTALVGRQRTAKGSNLLEPNTVIDFLENNPTDDLKQNTDLEKPTRPTKNQPAEKGAPKKKGPKITIGFEENENKGLLGRLIEDTLWVNRSHPAYQKAWNEGLEDYHILLTVAWVFSGFIEKDRSPLEFISQFLASWGREKQGRLLLFKK